MTPAGPRRWWVLSALCLTLFMTVLDNTVVNVAIPSIVEQLGATTADVQWMVNAYTVAVGSLAVAAGGIGDRVGYRAMWLAGLALFAGFSVLAVTAGEPVQLIVARAGMGVGGACVVPATLAVLTRVFSERDRPRAIGIWTAVAAGGQALGPLLGGALLARFPWQAVFALNIPIAVLCLVFARTWVPEFRGPGGRPDVAGALLSAAAMVGIGWAVIAAPGRGWTAPEVPASLVLGAALLAAFVRQEKRAREPMLDMALFRVPAFRLSVVTSLLAAFGLAGSIFLLTQHLQFDFGYSPLDAGVRTLPMAAGLLVCGSLVSARVGARLGAARGITAGMTLAAAGLAAIALVPLSAGYPALAPGLLAAGCGLGIAGPLVANALLGSVPPEQTGAASGTQGMLHETGASLGVAVLGAVSAALFTARLPGDLEAGSLAEALARARSGGQAEHARSAFAGAISAAQLTGAGLVLLCGAVAWFLPRTEPAVAAGQTTNTGGQQ
ncbi:MFS transporter [Amycolatopsis dendrobii]|uniref:MFS transporter n=1 Tax=Amycolatopsis dendrobii TaxID=2760662 RepID=A0A7W3W4V4_9PSEU|nr:MFS transporter [Amycolatopsis dendrobii]MBB1158407.1 MFS transporter [Amycolatopsis dendrobii]